MLLLLSLLLLLLLIYYYYYHYQYSYCTYCTSFNVDIRRFHIIYKKNLIKVGQKRGKITYLYKSWYCFLLLHLKYYQNFKNYHVWKLNKTDLVCLSSRTVFWNLRFYFCLDIRTRWYLYIHLEKDSMPWFCISRKYLSVWMLWPKLQTYLHGVWFFDKFESIRK